MSEGRAQEAENDTNTHVRLPRESISHANHLPPCSSRRKIFDRERVRRRMNTVQFENQVLDFLTLGWLNFQGVFKESRRIFIFQGVSRALKVKF